MPLISNGSPALLPQVDRFVYFSYTGKWTVEKKGKYVYTTRTWIHYI